MLATLALASCPSAPAQAGEVRLLGGGTRFEPGVARFDHTPEPAHRAVRARTYAQAGDGPVQQLQRMRNRGAITPDEYRDYRDEFRRSERFAAGLEGARRLDMTGVLNNIRSVAARGMFKPSRLRPLWLILERNREWWSSGPLLPSGERVSFPGSQLVFQYFPGEGLQFHPLANFGKLNALVTSRADADRTRKLMNELLDLAAWRSGALAWEYYFDFGGGAPAWVSSLAQGTGLQALSRAAARTGVQSEVFPELWHGLKIFKRRTPQGVRVPVAGPGDHYAQYSFAPSLRILNGFIQSLNGLDEFGNQTGFELARRLFAKGDARARVEVPTYDTGAWSLYARGSSFSESSLDYHVLLRDFLEDLCDRTGAAVHCRAERHFTRYLGEAPALRVLTRRLVAGANGTVRFKVSKISSVALTLSRGGRQVYAFSDTLGYGRHGLTIRPPRRARGKRYEGTIRATDLAGNSGSSDFTIEIRRK